MAFFDLIPADWDCEILPTGIKEKTMSKKNEESYKEFINAKEDARSVKEDSRQEIPG